MSSVPAVIDNPDENALRFPDVFTACAVTRAMSRAQGTQEYEETEGEAVDSFP